MSDNLYQRQYEKGYREQIKGLKHGQIPLADALHEHRSLGDAQRQGANQATEDYIKELERNGH